MELLSFWTLLASSLFNIYFVEMRQYLLNLEHVIAKSTHDLFNMILNIKFQHLLDLAPCLIYEDL